REPTRRRAAKRNSAGGCRHALPFLAAASAWPRKRTRRTSRADVDEVTCFSWLSQAGRPRKRTWRTPRADVDEVSCFCWLSQAGGPRRRTRRSARAVVGGGS